MKRPVAHEIEAKAQGLFKNALPVGWVPRQEIPDYGIDFVIEVFADGAATGLQFAVQLKGAKSVKVRRDIVSYSLETNHLAYYVDKVRLPVFLVRYDVSVDVGYWIFLQQYALETLANSAWRKQKTNSIRIPTCNLVSDTAALLEAAKKAEHYMTALRPAAIGIAAAAEKQRIESKDPRFNAVVRAENSRVAVELHARESVQCKFLLMGNGSELHKKVEDLIGRGLPVEFTKGEIAVEGLPSVQDVVAGGVTLQWTTQVPATMHLIAIDANKSEVGRIDSITGVFRGGMREATFDGGLGDSPLHLSVSIDIGEKKLVRSVHLAFDINRWTGHQLTFLPYFDQIHSVFASTQTGYSLVLRCFLLGNEFFSGQMILERDTVVDGISAIVLSLKKSREVAAALGLHTTMPDNLVEADLRGGEILHDVAVKGEYRRRARGERFGRTIHRPDRENIRKSLADPAMLVTGPIILHRGPYSFPFFREHVTIDDVEISVTSVRLATDPRSVLETLDKGDDQIYIEAEGSQEAEMVMRKPSTEHS